MELQVCSGCRHAQQTAEIIGPEIRNPCSTDFHNEMRQFYSDIEKSLTSRGSLYPCIYILQYYIQNSNSLLNMNLKMFQTRFVIFVKKFQFWMFLISKQSVTELHDFVLDCRKSVAA